MGEQPTGRLLMLAGLLVASLFIGMVSADEGDVALTANVVNAPDQPWYEPGHPLVLEPRLVNNGPAVSLLMNPACPVVLNVYNASNVMLVNGSSDCPQREQGLDLFAGEELALEAVSWSMKDEAGAWLESGTYTVELLHSAGASFITEATIQTPVSLPEDLTYAVQSTQRTTDGQAVHLVSLYNPTAQSVDLNEMSTCWLEISVNEHHRLGAPCTGDVSTLMPGEVMLVEQVSTNPSATVSISTPGDFFVFNTAEGEPTTTPASSLEMDLIMSGNELPAYSPGEVLVSEVLLGTTSMESVQVDFTDSCKAEMWVVDDIGNIVYDSRTGKTCTAIELEVVVEQDTPERLTLPQWNFYDTAGCMVEPGSYTVVAEVPEHGLIASEVVEFISAEVNPCAASDAAQLTASLTWQGDQTVRLNAEASNAQATYLRMAQPCTFEVAFLNQENDIVHVFQTLCDAYDGRKVLLPDASQPLEFDAFDISMVQDGAPLLPDGYYTLSLTMLATSPSTVTLPFAWPADFGVEEVEETVAEPAEPFELTGTWTGLLTDQGTCFVMDTGGETYLLSNARTLSTWQPSAQNQGIYLVVDTTPSPACSDYLAPSVEVVEVRMEQRIVSEETAPVVVLDEPTTTVVESSTVVTAVSVVVTASVLSMFVVVAATNEGLRLPATAAGLWFLGLIGKTHETTDGRYQRGRLMGYLTANPGCHFRALMSALDMSNGQITHHLRILEAEEHVWRKNDGRLVRFYPLTNKLHPNTSEEDLPVPPLSPDPNSLQGKILNVLDQDGDLGQFPTQAELAKRLEKSQQLISHHLRTLQKYGLVERRKMGVKNRYKLTREAVFLLETSDDFAHDDFL
ncbi:MAG: ArsR family transcriptional regulator [Poseidonia sp.]